MPFQQTIHSAVSAGATFHNPCQDERPNPSGTSFHLDTRQKHLSFGFCLELPALPIGSSPANTAHRYQCDLDYAATAFRPCQRRS